MSDERDDLATGGIAIIGMVGRFPGARDLDTFWRNICDGAESITTFKDEELQPFGFDAAAAKNPNYVKARGIVEDAELFDPAFFGYSGRDALLMDPQHRLFLESSWEALETAGYDPRTYKGLIGVYGGSTQSSYQPYLYGHFDLLPNPDGLQIALGNDLPFLTTRVSFKLDLKGPSCPVQTACSTSLVAIHLACQGLLNAECDMALAGGVSLRLPQKTGYVYQEDSILSPDGHCRSFDAGANGTVFSNGIGMVVLKRLDDAMADGDTIHAVIRGSAINNDGARRASFTAPGVYGQSHVISDALAAAAVGPDTISYIEAHGTATSLGDSIEIQALSKAFARATDKKQFCAIGTVKSNIGHLDAAAGVAGLIKTALMLRNRTLPPAAMFTRPNPDLQIESTPFYVNTSLKEWKAPEEEPLRAGISSFGFGGTNAHVIVEEPPAPEPTDQSREFQVLVMSAESADGLERFSSSLAGHFARYSKIDVADAAFTLQAGRRAFRHRRAIVCRSIDEARGLLDSRDPRLVFSGVHDAHERPVVFMFPGQGSQHVDMARGLYDAEPAFRTSVDECAALLTPHLGSDIRELIFPKDGVTPEHSERLTRTAHAQPALFVIEYALARLYMSWGVQPAAMIGHSVGEWVAACLAGVVSLADALRLVALRGRVMEEMPRGVMAAVGLPESTLRPMLGSKVWIATINAPSMCVISGAEEDVAAVEAKLRADGIEPQRLQTSHAFHSGMMDPAVPKFVEAVAQVKLSAPAIPFISNVTGAPINETDATSPAYWGRQIREAVRFSDGVAALADAECVFLEVGPGQALTTLVRRQPGINAQRVVPTLRRPQEQTPDESTLATALARLWVSGAHINWNGYRGEERRRRIPLPTYAFDRQRYWVSRPSGAKGPALFAPPKRGSHDRLPDLAEWFHAPSWTRVPALRTAGEDPLATRATWLVFADRHGVAKACVDVLQAAGHDVVTVTEGAECVETAPGRWTLDPFSRPQFDQLVRELGRSSRMPDRVLHCWGVGDAVTPAPGAIAMEREHYVLFWSLTLLASALADANAGSVRITTVTTGVQNVTGDEPLRPGKSPVLGLCRVIPQEHSNLAVRSIDLATADAAFANGVIARLLQEASTAAGDSVVAYRSGLRWIETFRPVALPPVAATPARLRQNGVYLITGGVGDIALNFGEYLATAVNARLVLLGRSGMPDESTWDEYVRTKGASDLTALRILRLRRIQQLGGQVMVVQANAANPQQLAAAFAAAEARFGPVNGVIHAAGLVTGDAFRTVLESDEDIVTRQFEPKVTALAALDLVMRGRSLDFCMLVSSLSVILGGLRYAAYAAANTFLDAVAHERNRSSAFPWITVNWDGWLRAEDEAALKKGNKPVSGFVMTGAEGAEAFARILGYEAGDQIVVSTGDLQARIDQWVKLTSVSEQAAAPAADMVRLPRPNLQTEFVAPRTDLERTLAGIWQNLLALERVGVNDSFFELGGDSLLGIQLTSTVKKQLGAKVSAVTLFEAPTVASLATLIESRSQPAGTPSATVDAGRSRGERRREKLRGTAPLGA
jgi:acyl transferase domain-containing protein/acyl carrier protein